jgi:hypothetical protein
VVLKVGVKPSSSTNADALRDGGVAKCPPEAAHVEGGHEGAAAGGPVKGADAKSPFEATHGEGLLEGAAAECPIKGAAGEGSLGVASAESPGEGEGLLKGAGGNSPLESAGTNTAGAMVTSAGTHSVVLSVCK